MSALPPVIGREAPWLPTPLRPSIAIVAARKRCLGKRNEATRPDIAALWGSIASSYFFLLDREHRLMAEEPEGDKQSSHWNSMQALVPGAQAREVAAMSVTQRLCVRPERPRKRAGSGMRRKRGGRPASGSGMIEPP